ncbi:MAG: class I SAM-dependent methyltransferase [Anderseniella sp.]
MIDDETISAYNNQVEAYADLTRSTSTDPLLVAFMTHVVLGGHILDLGCGPANAAAEMREHNFEVDAVDASPEMVRLANKTHDIGARLATFDDIDGYDTYDGIWANFSLLHAPVEDFPRHLNALYRALKPGGHFHIGMKLGTGSARDKLGRHYSYYSQSELSDLLNTAGFVVVTASTGEDLGLAGDIEAWIALRAHKQAV